MRWRGPYSVAHQIGRLPGCLGLHALPPVPDPRARNVSRPGHVPGSPPGGARFQTVTIFLRRHLHCQPKYSPTYFFRFFIHIGIHRIRTVARIQPRLSTVYAHLIHKSRKVARAAANRVRQGRELSWPDRGLADHSPRSFPVAGLRLLSGAGATSDVPSCPNRGLVWAAARDRAVRHRVRR